MDREGGRTDDTTSFCSTLHSLVVARLSGLHGEVERRVGRDSPCLTNSSLDLLRQAASD